MTTTSIFVPHSPEKAALHSGCTSNLIQSSIKRLEKTATSHGLRVGIPNGQIMQASHNAFFNLQHLPIHLSCAACKATVQPALQKSLISLGQLCDHGCDYVLLDRHYASIIKDGVTTVVGLRDPTNGLWLMDLEPSDTPTPLPAQHPTYKHCANSAYEQKTKIQLIVFFFSIERVSAHPSLPGRKPPTKISSPPGPASPPTLFGSFYQNPWPRPKVTSKPHRKTSVPPPKLAQPSRPNSLPQS
jgi:hypothetical protein